MTLDEKIEFLDSGIDTLQNIANEFNMKIVFDHNLTGCDCEDDCDCESDISDAILTLIDEAGTTVCETEADTFENYNELTSFLVQFVTDSKDEIKKYYQRLEFNTLDINKTMFIAEETDAWFGTYNRTMLGVFESRALALFEAMEKYDEILTEDSGGYKSIKENITNTNVDGIYITEVVLNERM